MSTSAPRRSRDRALTAVGATVSIAALAAIVVWALYQEPPSLPQAPDRLAELAAAVAFYLAACAARAERWYELLRYNGASPRRADAYALLAVAYAGNNVLPARAGDALRVLLLTPRAQTDARTIIGTIVAERVLDVVVLVGLFVALAYTVLGGVDLPSAGGLAVAAVLAGALLALAATATYVLHRRRRLGRVLAFLAPMAEATRRLRGNHGRELLAWTLLVWTLEWAAWWLTAEAAGLGLGMLDAGYVLGLASMFLLVPSGPGFVGTFDAAVVLGVGALGGTGAQALSYVLLLRFVVTVPITLVGLVVLAVRHGGLERIRGLVRA